MTLPIDLPPAGLLPGALKQVELLQRLPLDLHRNLGIVYSECACRYCLLYSARVPYSFDGDTTLGSNPGAGAATGGHNGACARGGKPAGRRSVAGPSPGGPAQKGAGNKGTSVSWT